MVDIHDRRPVVLQPDEANLWLSQDTTPDQAGEIMHNLVRLADEFEWWTVDPAVGNVRNNWPGLVAPWRKADER